MTTLKKKKKKKKKKRHRIFHAVCPEDIPRNEHSLLIVNNLIYNITAEYLKEFDSECTGNSVNVIHDTDNMFIKLILGKSI